MVPLVLHIHLHFIPVIMNDRQQKHIFDHEYDFPFEEMRTDCPFWGQLSLFKFGLPERTSDFATITTMHLIFDWLIKKKKTKMSF